jgi:hypothetical protein
LAKSIFSLMKEWKIALLILIWPALLLGGGFYMYQRATKPRIEIRNLSRAVIESLAVEYAPNLSNGVGLRKEPFGDIKPGVDVEFQFPEGEYFVNVSFSQAGRSRQLECGVIGDTKTGMFLVNLLPDPESSECAKLSVIEAPK